MENKEGVEVFIDYPANPFDIWASIICPMAESYRRDDLDVLGKLPVQQSQILGHQKTQKESRGSSGARLDIPIISI